MGFTPILKVFCALHICIANCAGHKKCPYSECMCVLPAKQDSIICTYLALGCIAHKRKHNQTIVCQVRNELVAAMHRITLLNKLTTIIYLVYHNIGVFMLALSYVGMLKLAPSAYIL